MNRVSNFIIFLMLLSVLSCTDRKNRNYLQYVNMLTGTAYPKMAGNEYRGSEYIYGGQVIPAVSYPFGMTQWTPQTQYSERKMQAPFYSGKIRFQGFRATHWLNGSDEKDYGSFTIFPTNLNDHRFLPHQRETMFMYNTETSSPAYLSVLLPEQNIMTEITSTKRCALFRISWIEPKLPSVIFDVNSDDGKGFIKIDTSANEIFGYNPVFIGDGVCKRPAGISGYFVIRFNKDLKDFGTYSGMSYFPGDTEKRKEKNIGAYITFANSNESVILKVGTSFTSIENARANLDAEISAWDFNKAKEELEKVWNNALGKIDVESDNAMDMTMFYTSLYRCMLQPRLYSDVNGEYRGFGNDSSVHVAEGFDYYGDFAAWNTYRAQMPLVSLLMPKEYNDMIRSLIVKAEQEGSLPVSTFCNNYVGNPKGDYCAAIISDALIKGFKFDTEKAYSFMRANAFEKQESANACVLKGRPFLGAYEEFGYVPVDEGIQGQIKNGGGEVTLTLDYSYIDYILSKTALKLGRKKDNEELEIRSYNYSNLYDTTRQSINGKDMYDTFTDYFSEDEYMPFLIEGTPAQYTFFVPHDVPGLIEMMGDDTFRNKLDNLINNNKLWPGNEPGQIIPYLYNYIGRWDKTQGAVKNILRSNYSTAIDGLVRNDKGAQMSAWYVFSSMGFYPVCPVSNSYSLSAPLFDEVTIYLDDEYYSGEKFVITGEKKQDGSPYAKAELNGKKISPSITFEEITSGGKLKFIGE